MNYPAANRQGSSFLNMSLYLPPTINNKIFSCNEQNHYKIFAIDKNIETILWLLRIKVEEKNCFFDIP